MSKLEYECPEDTFLILDEDGNIEKKVSIPTLTRDTGTIMGLKRENDEQKKQIYDLIGENYKLLKWWKI